MAVTRYKPLITGLAGEEPNIVLIKTNDTVGTVTTSGYLNNYPALTSQLNKFDMALVYTTTGPEWFQVSITGTGPNYTYSLINTQSGGNVIAGSNGNAGYLATYPATASTGYLEIQGVSNSANYVTTISNDAFGQASTMNIPDPGNAVGQFMVGATATPFVSGNLPKASGTAGVFVDSGISVTAGLSVLTATVTLTASQVNGAYAAPVVLIAAPGAGLTIIPIQMAVYTNVSTPFAGGANAAVQWGNTVHGAGTNAFSAVIPTAEITAAASQVYILGTHSAAALTSITNLGLYFSNITQAFTTGTGSTVTFVIQYYVMTATV